FQYPITATIDLNTEPLCLSNSTYQASEIENLLLSSTNNSSSDNNFKSNLIDYNNNNNNNNNYIPLKTNFDTSPVKATSKFNEFPLDINARKSNRIFSTDHSIIIQHIETTYRLMLILAQALFMKDIKMLMIFTKGSQLDHRIYLDYLHVTVISQLFNKLLRKSFLLLSMDYYKNTILKQKMLKFATCKEKLAISCVCENLSVISIGEITNIIKNDYLPFFNNFFIGGRNLFLGSFFILDDCLGYHFKNGLKYDMSFEEGNKAVKLVGIFSTGIYSIIMARSKENTLLTSTNMISSYLITFFRRILTKNYNVKIFEQFKFIVDKHSNDLNHDINYENLKYFCDKHLPLLNANIHENSLLGFNNGYLIRIYNSFKSISPFNLINLTNGIVELFEGRELDIIIFLYYSTVAHILDALMPGRNIVCGSFTGSEMDIYSTGNITKLMRLFGYIRSQSLKLTAIYLIRTGLFIRWQWTYYKNYLSNLTLAHLLEDDKEMSIIERYLRLKNFKDNCVVDEITVKTFLLDKGQFFKKWNYPNYSGNKPKRIDKVSENKIMNFFDHDENALIEDFIKTNTGFLSMDYDITADKIGNDSIIMRTKFVDENQIKILWKLVTYIRINNL
ncbi:hypothetical protein C6P42_004150, partial [Pichia californica]